MRRTHYLVLILLLIAQTTFGQIYQNMAQPGYKFSRARFDSVLTIPTGLGNLKNISGGQDTGQIRFNKSDSSVYVWNGRAWIKAGGGTIPTLQQVTTAGNVSQNSINVEGNDNTEIKLSSDINAGTFAKFRIASGTSTIEMGQQGEGTVALGFSGAGATRSIQIPDADGTIALLSDTSTLSNRINTKLNISDTAAMLAPYTRVTVTSYGKNATRDSTILLLSNGTRYAAKDSVGGGGSSGWGLTGNASAVTDFLGTTNSRTMRFRTNNTERMILDSVGRFQIYQDFRIGTGTSGQLMTVGFGNNSPASSENTAMGVQSGINYDAGGTRRNSSFGFRSGGSVTSGYFNTLIGAYAGNAMTTGFENTAIGVSALTTNNTSGNVAVGSSALNSNTGNNNVAVGNNAGFYRAVGNTDLGYQSGNNASANGNYNVSIGWRAGQYSGDYKYYVAAIPATNGNLLYGDFQTGQLKINNTNTPSLIASAQLEVESTTRGVLFPRMTTTQKNAIASPAAGLVVYDTTLGKLCVRTASTWETITSL